MDGAGGRGEAALRGAVGRLLDAHGAPTCLLLVDADVWVMEAAVGRLLSWYGWPRLPVGRELSAALLPEPPRQRPRRVQPWMMARMVALAPGPVVCTEIDLLFEPALELEPLVLLRRVSRVAKLVVAWPGSYADGALAYAVPEHVHYRTWSRPEVDVVMVGEGR